MTPRRRATLQDAILTACKRDGALDAELAAVAGCDRSLVSRYRSGERRLDVDELDGLARVYGPAAVYGPLVAAHGGLVTELEDGPPAIGVMELGTATAGQAGTVLAELLACVADGRLDRDEAARLRPLVAQLQQQLAAVDERCLRAAAERR